MTMPIDINMKNQQCPSLADILAVEKRLQSYSFHYRKLSFIQQLLH